MEQYCHNLALDSPIGHDPLKNVVVQTDTFNQLCVDGRS